MTIGTTDTQLFVFLNKSEKLFGSFQIIHVNAVMQF